MLLLLLMYLTANVRQHDKDWWLCNKLGHGILKFDTVSVKYARNIPKSRHETFTMCGNPNFNDMKIGLFRSKFYQMLSFSECVAWKYVNIVIDNRVVPNSNVSSKASSDWQQRKHAT